MSSEEAALSDGSKPQEVPPANERRTDDAPAGVTTSEAHIEVEGAAVPSTVEEIADSSTAPPLDAKSSEKDRHTADVPGTLTSNENLPDKNQQDAEKETSQQLKAENTNEKHSPPTTETTPESEQGNAHQADSLQAPDSRKPLGDKADGDSEGKPKAFKQTKGGLIIQERPPVLAAKEIEEAAVDKAKGKAMAKSKSDVKRRHTEEIPAKQDSFSGFAMLSRGLSSLQQGTAAAAKRAQEQLQELSSGKNAEKLEEIQLRVSETSKEAMKNAEKLQENAKAAFSSLLNNFSEIPSPSQGSAGGVQNFWRSWSTNATPQSVPRTSSGRPVQAQPKAANPSVKDPAGVVPEASDSSSSNEPAKTSEEGSNSGEETKPSNAAEQGDGGSLEETQATEKKDVSVEPDRETEAKQAAALANEVASGPNKNGKPLQTGLISPATQAAAAAAASAAAAQAAAAGEAAGAAAAAAAAAAAQQATAARDAASAAASAAAAKAAQQAAAAREAAAAAADKAKEALSSFTSKLVDESKTLTAMLMDESKTAAKNFQTRAKHMASQNKRRYQAGGFDLDLSYITDTIIAMSFPTGEPSSGLMGAMEGLYRNNVDEVIRFLDTYHKNHYMVYNFCSERQYSPSVFHGKAVSFPFEDGSVPPLSLVMKFCQHAKEWLQKSKAEGGPDNVIAVHCKAGLGRSGLMVSCLLLYLKFYTSAEDAVNFFSAKRCLAGPAITVPSQLRYVRYFEAAMRGPEAPKIPEPKRYFLRGIRLHKCPFWLRPAVVLADQEGIIFSSRRHPKTKDILPNDLWFPSKQRKSVMVFAVPGERGFAEVQGDFQLCFLDKNGDFHCWLNTAFLEPRTFLTTQDFDNMDKRRAPCPGLVVEVVLIDNLGAPIAPSKGVIESTALPGPPPSLSSTALLNKAQPAPQLQQTSSFLSRLTGSANLSTLMGMGPTEAAGASGQAAGATRTSGGGASVSHVGRGRSREEELHPDIFSDSDDEEEALARHRAAAAGVAGSDVVPGDLAGLGVTWGGLRSGAKGPPEPGTPAAALGVFTDALSSSVRDAGKVGGQLGDSVRKAVAPHLGSPDVPGTPAAALGVFTGALSSSLKDVGTVGEQIGSSMKSAMASYTGQSPVLNPAQAEASEGTKKLPEEVKKGVDADVLAATPPSQAAAGPQKTVDAAHDSASITREPESKVKTEAPVAGAPAAEPSEVKEASNAAPAAATTEGSSVPSIEDLLTSPDLGIGPSADFAVAAASAADASVFTFGDDEDMEDFEI